MNERAGGKFTSVLSNNLIDVTTSCEWPADDESRGNLNSAETQNDSIKVSRKFVSEHGKKLDCKLNFSLLNYSFRSGIFQLNSL